VNERFGLAQLRGSSGFSAGQRETRQTFGGDSGESEFELEVAIRADRERAQPMAAGDRRADREIPAIARALERAEVGTLRTTGQRGPEVRQFAGFGVSLDGLTVRK